MMEWILKLYSVKSLMKEYINRNKIAYRLCYLICLLIMLLCLKCMYSFLLKEKYLNNAKIIGILSKDDVSKINDKNIYINRIKIEIFDPDSGEIGAAPVENDIKPLFVGELPNNPTNENFLKLYPKDILVYYFNFKYQKNNDVNVRYKEIYELPGCSKVKVTLQYNNKTGKIVMCTLAQLYGLPKNPYSSLQQMGALESQLNAVLAGFALTVAVMLLERRGGNNKQHRIGDAFLYRASISLFVCALAMTIIASCLGLIVGQDPNYSHRAMILHCFLTFNFSMGAILIFHGLYLSLLASNEKVEYRTAENFFIIAVMIGFLYCSFSNVISGIHFSRLKNAVPILESYVFQYVLFVLAIARMFWLRFLNNRKNNVYSDGFSEIQRSRMTEKRMLYEIAKVIFDGMGKERQDIIKDIKNKKISNTNFMKMPDMLRIIIGVILFMSLLYMFVVKFDLMNILNMTRIAFLSLVWGFSVLFISFVRNVKSNKGFFSGYFLDKTRFSLVFIALSCLMSSVFSFVIWTANDGYHFVYVYNFGSVLNPIDIDISALSVLLNEVLIGTGIMVLVGGFMPPAFYKVPSIDNPIGFIYKDKNMQKANVMWYAIVYWKYDEADADDEYFMLKETDKESNDGGKLQASISDDEYYERLRRLYNHPIRWEPVCHIVMNDIDNRKITTSEDSDEGCGVFHLYFRGICVSVLRIDYDPFNEIGPDYRLLFYDNDSGKFHVGKNFKINLLANTKNRFDYFETG